MGKAESAVESGLITIYAGEIRTYSGEGKKRLTFGVCGPGESFGELTLSGGPRTTSIEAITDTNYTLISKQQVMDYIGQCPEFTFDLLDRAIQRHSVVTATARALALKDNYERLATSLNQLSGGDTETHGDAVIQISQQDLASRVGCSREMVSLLIKDLKTGGFIESSRGSIRVIKKLPAAW